MASLGLELAPAKLSTGAVFQKIPLTGKKYCLPCIGIKMTTNEFTGAVFKSRRKRIMFGTSFSSSDIIFLKKWLGCHDDINELK